MASRGHLHKNTDQMNTRMPKERRSDEYTHAQTAANTRGPESCKHSCSSAMRPGTREV
jgi:hypothetical protein